MVRLQRRHTAAVLFVIRREPRKGQQRLYQIGDGLRHCYCRNGFEMDERRVVATRGQEEHRHHGVREVKNQREVGA